MKRKLPAPRNPFVAVAMFKKAGTHVKPHKAIRRTQEVNLKREYGVAVAQHPFKVPGPGSNPGAPTKTSTKAARLLPMF